MDPFTLFQPPPTPPAGVASWVDLQMLDAARAQARAAWAGAVVQAVALVAAAVAAVYAKGAYEATSRQAEIARDQYDQARRSDAAQMVHELLEWLTFQPGGRLADHGWRMQLAHLEAAELSTELSNNLRQHAPGQQAGEAQVIARRLGGGYLDRYSAVIRAHEILYLARVEWGRTTGGQYVDPQGAFRATVNASPAASELKASTQRFLSALDDFEHSIGRH